MNLDRFNDDAFRYFNRHTLVESPECPGCGKPLEFDGYCEDCLIFELEEEEECQTHLTST